MGYGRGGPHGKVSPALQAGQKVAILREHLVEQMPVSEVCEKHQIHPTVFYQWQERYGKANEHNGLVPRDHWLEEWERRPSSSSVTNIRWRVIAG